VPEPDGPPVVALRTYSAIRMGVVAVIFALGVAVAREIHHAEGHCVQRSLSAYYYTPARPVFVGALLIIGFVMVAMWGKTPVEDAALNLAGLLLTAVAFVPTLDYNYCALPPDMRDQIPDGATRTRLDEVVISANAAEVHSSFFTYLVTSTAILAGVAIVGSVAYLRASEERRPTRHVLVTYVITWALAALAVIGYAVLYRDADDVTSAFNHDLHGWSANLAVAFVIVAVVAAAVDKARNDSGPWWTDAWVWLYGALATAMLVAAAVFKLGGDRLLSGWYASHRTFLLEAIVIALLAVFWVVQTIDRWDEGAPRY
jgi:hypothetical protein